MSKIKLMIEVEDEDELDWVVNRGCIMADRLRNAKRIEESDDAISRQAVIDITWEEPSYTDALNVLTEVRDKVKALPSVNPKSDVLDKLKAKINVCLEALDEIEKSGYNIYLPNEMSGRRLSYKQCLEFIDSCRMESEEKE